MKKIIVEKRMGCVAFAATIMGDKWNPLIIRILCNGSSRFSLLQGEMGINPRTLSARLDFLEHHRIIERTLHSEVPPRVEYSLTPKGQDLIPILKSMARWGDKYQCPTESVD